MSETVACVRCAESRPALEAPPFSSRLGGEIQAKICSPCWEEWKEQEVRVINELRLNFMDPKSEDILLHHMREFLMLAEPPTSAAE